MLTKKNKKSEGFVILYAVIITTVVLVVGVSLMNIMTKQLVLSSISRNAKISYYAALSGRDCAEFWKTVQTRYYDSVSDTFPKNYFGKSNLAGNVWIDPVPTTEIICSDVTPLTTVVTGSSGLTATSFQFNININGQTACASVIVDADSSKQGDCATDQILVSSDGYNASCEEVFGSNPNPRTVRSIYSDRETCPTTP